MGNYYTKKESDILFCENNDMISDYYTKQQANSKFSPKSLENKLINFHTKSESDSEFYQKADDVQGILTNNYYDKSQADASFIKKSLLEDKMNNYYDKEDADNIFAPISVKNDLDQLRSNIETNYYKSNEIDSKYVTNNSFDTKASNYYTGDQTRQYCSFPAVGYNTRDLYNMHNQQADLWINNIIPTTFKISDFDQAFYKKTRYDTLAYNLNDRQFFAMEPEHFKTSIRFKNDGLLYTIRDYVHVKNDGFISCLLRTDYKQQNINGTVYLYYSEVNGSPTDPKPADSTYRQVAGCSINYQYGLDFEVLSASFNYPVKKGHSFSVKSFCIQGSNAVDAVCTLEYSML